MYEIFLQQQVQTKWPLLSSLGFSLMNKRGDHFQFLKTTPRFPLTQIFLLQQYFFDWIND